MTYFIQRNYTGGFSGAWEFAHGDEFPPNSESHVGAFFKRLDLGKLYKFDGAGNWTEVGGGGVGGTVEVAEADGTPSMTADRLIVDQADGMTLTDLGSGDARLDLSGVPEAVLALNFPTHSNANDPTAGEKAALAGTSGAPDAGNKYVTDADARNTNARTPTLHASSHQDLGADEISVAGLSGLLADQQTPLTHDIITKHNGFPADTTKFLRGDGTFAVPPAGGSTPTGTGFRHVTAGVEDAASKLVNLTAASDVAANQGTTTTLLHGNAAGQASFSAVVTADISDNQVTPAKLDDGAAFSVLGKATTGSGDRADITVAADRLVGRDGSGDVDDIQVKTAHVADDQVTYAKIQNMTTNRILGRLTAGAGDIEELSLAQMLSFLNPFTQLNVQVFTATGANTYTPVTGMKYCLVFTTGAGGGGGGADVTGAADTAAGGGGGAGGTAIEFFNAGTIGASQTVTIGSGGNGGNNTGSNGTTGGDTTFGALHTGVGGVGGTGSGAASAVNTRTVAGGAGGTPTGGLANIIGGAGQNGWAMQTTDATDTNETSIAMGGQGGGSFWGSGGRAGSNAQDAAAADSTAGSEAGSAGGAFGSGGGGAAVQNTATGIAGGRGADGFCLVIEFA